MELGQERIYNKYHKYFKINNTYKNVKIRLFYYYNIG